VKGLQSFSTVSVLLAVFAGARADLSTSIRAQSWLGDSASLLSAYSSNAPAAEAERSYAPASPAPVPSRETGVFLPRLPAIPQALDSGLEGAAEVRGLPPTPSSILLSLTAFGGLAAWQLGRSAKHVKLGHFPEWFHTGAPARIGRATVWDLTTSVAQPAACFESPGGGDFTPPVFVLGEAVLPPSPRILTPQQTRGPPLPSL